MIDTYDPSYAHIQESYRHKFALFFD